MNKLKFLSFLLLLLMACGPNEGDTKIQNTVNAFYNSVLHKNYKTAYKLTDDEFKKIIPEDKLNELLRQINLQYGNYRSREIAGWQVQTKLGGNSSYHYTYKVQYEKASTTEDLYMSLKDGAATILRYDVNPAQPVVK